ncbi:MAG: hypothetical protein QGD94_10215, partial [Planctomycetia bacterium]|nr:hypothetical protein [Planctomycetia bacterium]
MRRRRTVATVAVAAAFVLLLAGCGQRVNWPKQPMFVFLDDGGTTGDVGYDLNRDGVVDYVQHIEGGLKTRFRIDTDADGDFDVEFERGKGRRDTVRTLVVLLDGINHSMVRDLREEGHFRLFHPPAPLISSFPAVTDTGWADVFNTERPNGMEGDYFDRSRNKRAGGLSYFINGGQEKTWNYILAHRTPMALDGLVYKFPRLISTYELQKSIEAYYRSDSPTVYLYIVTIDSLAHQWPEERVRRFLIRIDRALERMYYDARGNLRIFMLAPHGHNNLRGKMVPIRRDLKKAGFPVADNLEKPHAVMIPAFGVLTNVVLYTNSPERVAKAAVGFHYVDLAIHRDAGNDRVVVASRGGLAHVVSRNGKYAYIPNDGDPLQLEKIVQKMKADGAIDADGFATADAWFDYTWDHIYAHPVVNVWRAFHG